MIINNLIIGLDKYGTKLECGDFCEFEYTNHAGDSCKRKGLIVYDEESFSFGFEMLDNNFPLLLMSNTSCGSIKKLFNVRYIDSEYPNAKNWIDIYNSNLLIAHLD